MKCSWARNGGDPATATAVKDTGSTEMALSHADEVSYPLVILSLVWILHEWRRPWPIRKGAQKGRPSLLPLSESGPSPALRDT